MVILEPNTLYTVTYQTQETDCTYQTQETDCTYQTQETDCTVYILDTRNRFHLEIFLKTLTVKYNKKFSIFCDLNFAIQISISECCYLHDMNIEQTTLQELTSVNTWRRSLIVFLLQNNNIYFLFLFYFYFVFLPKHIVLKSFQS